MYKKYNFCRVPLASLVLPCSTGVAVAASSIIPLCCGDSYGIFTPIDADAVSEHVSISGVGV